MPAPAVPPSPHAAKAKLSPEAIAAIRAAARGGTAAASSALSQIGVEVDGEVSKALAHLPAQLAQLDSDENISRASSAAKRSEAVARADFGVPGLFVPQRRLARFDFHGLTLKSR